MNIQQAARIASQKGGAIYRKTDASFFQIIPTDTEVCCIAALHGESLDTVPYWNPKLEDLTADDWEVTE